MGWDDGHNVRIETRFGAARAEIQKNAAELVALAPEAILANGSPATDALLKVTRTVPIVFTVIVDPVGTGYVESLARPGGNATGFINFEFGIGAKWLEQLREIAPRMTRIAVLRDPALPSGIGQFGAIQSVTPALGMEVTPINLRDTGEIERAVTAFSRSPHGGLIVTGSALAAVHRDLIIALAAKNSLPAIYFERLFVAAGGLTSYGPDLLDQFRVAAGYVDRILNGEKPADLAVQAPTKYELAIDLKTAKALGLDIPATVLARADEVIE